MADPLSVTASFIALLQLTQAVISVCHDYKSAVCKGPTQLTQVLDEIKGLRLILEDLESIANEAEDQAAPVEGPSESDSQNAAISTNDFSHTHDAVFKLLAASGGPLQRCQRELAELETRLLPPKWSGPAGSKRRAAIQVMGWPMKEKETTKRVETLSRLRGILELALATDQR